MALRTSHSQPHLLQSQRTPLQGSRKSLDPPNTGPSKLHGLQYQQQRNNNNNGNRRTLSRSESAATVGSITSIAEVDEENYYSGAHRNPYDAIHRRPSSAPRSRPAVSAATSAATTRPHWQSAPFPPQKVGGEADALLAHYSGGKTAPPKWCVQAMRALESSYERKLHEARQATLLAEEAARQAAHGIVAVEATKRNEESFVLSSVERASEATEMANRVHFEAQHENDTLRRAVAAAQHAQGDAEARALHAQHEVKEMVRRVERAEMRAAEAENRADAERARTAAAEKSLEESRDEGSGTRIALERAAAEWSRVNAEAERLRDHSRKLAQGVARGRPGGAPQPLAMGSPEEWNALREERDALLRLMVQLHRAADGAQRAGARTVRVGGGYERLPEYLAKLTGALPPELRQQHPPPPVVPEDDDDAPEGALAATHNTQVRYVANAAHASHYARRHGLQTAQAPPWRGAGTPRATHALFAPARPVSVLVHQKGPPAPPPRMPVAETTPANLTPAYNATYDLKDYPAVGRPELFAPPARASPRRSPMRRYVTKDD